MNLDSADLKPLKFVAARLQFVSTQDDLFSGTTPPDEGKKIFNELFCKSEGFTIKPKRPRGKIVEMYLDPICSDDGQFLGARIGKSKRLMIPILEDNHLVEKPISAYPFVLLLWDSSNQVILAQQNTMVFADVSLPIEILILYLNSHLSIRGLIAKWDLIKEHGTFWKAFGQFEAIYSLKIDLTAPNLFGSTYKRADEFSRMLREETNGTDFSIGINHDEGKIKLNSDDELIRSIAEVIDAGGGNLRIGGVKRGKKKKNKERLNLKKQYKYIIASQEFNDRKYLNAGKILDITKNVQQQYNLKRKNNDENDK